MRLSHILLVLLLLMPRGASGEECDINSTATLRISFNGLVDLVSDRTENPSMAWILLPNATNPSSLPDRLKGYGVSPHEPRLLFDEKYYVEGTIDGKNYIPCHACDQTPLTFRKVIGKHLTLHMQPLVNDLRVFREGLTGSVPCNLFNPGCTIEKALTADWLIDIDDTVAEPFNDGFLVDPFITPVGDYPLLATRLLLDRGTIMAGEYWRKEHCIGEFIKVYFYDKAEARAAASSLVLEVPIRGCVVVRQRPLGSVTGTEEDIKLKPVDRLIEIRVDNQPLRPQCQAGPSDFKVHFAFRSTTMPPELIWINPPSDNPQCSPGDNKWP